MSRILPILFLAAPLTVGCHAGKIDRLESQIDDQNSQISSLQDQNYGYAVEVSQLREEVDRLEKRHAELAGWYDGVLQAFGPALDAGEVRLVIYPNRTTLEFPEPIYFESGAASLNETGGSTIKDLAALISKYPGQRFQVEGHTDPEPIATARYPDNWALGSARALTVVRALIGEGVSPGQLSAATYGETSPIAANADGEGQAQNRRIAVAIEPTPAQNAEHVALFERARERGRLVTAMGLPADATPVAIR